MGTTTSTMKKKRRAAGAAAGSKQPTDLSKSVMAMGWRAGEVARDSDMRVSNVLLFPSRHRKNPRVKLQMTVQPRPYLESLMKN